MPKKDDRRSIIAIVTAVVAIAIVAVVVIVAWVNKTLFPPKNPNTPVKYDATTVWGDVVGNLTTYTPPTMNVPLTMPLNVALEGKAGELGHMGIGLFGMTQWKSAYPEYPYKTAVFKVKLNRIAVTKDAGFIRIGLATAWKRISDGRYYYLEFDLWDSDATVAQMPNDSYVFYKPEGDPPTIEVKTAQLVVGSLAYYELPIYDYFVKAFGVSDVEIDGCYLVIEKTDPASIFGVTVEFLYLGLA